MAGNWWENYSPVSAPLAPKALSGGDQKRIADLEQGADEAGRLASTAADFVDRNKRTATGGWLAAPGTRHIAGALGLGGDDLNAMDRDSIQMATQLRAPGQRLTQMEFSKNLGATPSIGTTGDKNAANAQGIYNVHAAAAAQAAYYRAYAEKNGTLNGADTGWLRFKSQHFGPDGSFIQDPSQSADNSPGQALKAKSAAYRGASDPLGIR